MKPVKKAVLPVAGFGTRVLPATKTIPKEMLTVVDRPALQYVVDEAIEAGIELSRRVNPDSWTARPLFKSWPKGAEFQTAREAIDFAIKLNQH